MDFGKTFKNTVLPLGRFFGVLVILFSVTYVAGNLFGRGNLEGIDIGLILGALLAWLVAICLLFLLTSISLHITNEIVQVRLFKRFILREENTNGLDFIEVLTSRTPSPNGVTLKFSNSRSIRMYFHYNEVEKLLKYVSVLTNNRVRVKENN